jgi:hypothetical protein
MAQRRWIVRGARFARLNRSIKENPMNSSRRLLAALTIAGSLALAPLIARAAPPAPVTQSATATATATITAIDYTQRIVSLQFTDGTTQTISVGPNVTRFPQLKVGDTVTFTTSASMVYSIAKPGAAPPDSATMTAAQGVKPGGTATQTKSTIVTIVAIDPNVPSVTVKTADGQVVAMKVNDPKNIVGVKVGDKVQITYTESTMISVK